MALPARRPSMLVTAGRRFNPRERKISLDLQVLPRPDRLRVSIRVSGRSLWTPPKGYFYMPKIEGKSVSIRVSGRSLWTLLSSSSSKTPSACAHWREYMPAAGPVKPPRENRRRGPRKDLTKTVLSHARSPPLCAYVRGPCDHRENPLIGRVRHEVLARPKWRRRAVFASREPLPSAPWIGRVATGKNPIDTIQSLP